MINDTSERLKQLRHVLNIKQGEFAKRISTTQGHISDIENGRKDLSDRTIKLIGLEFNVNENWLRTGEGGEAAMFNKLDTDEKLSYALGKILAGDDEFVKRTMLSLAELDKDQWAVIKNLVKKIAGETI